MSRRTSKLVPLFLLLMPLSLAAQPAQKPAAPASGPHPEAAGDVQILLDRAGFSSGLIDAQWGSNTRKALTAFQQAKGLPATGQADPASWQALLTAAGNQVLVPYTLTAEDVDGPFTPKIPEDMEEKAGLSALGFTSVLELLTERFHTTPELLRRLNPKAGFATVGEQLRVPNVRLVGPPKQGDAPEGARVTVSKSASTVTVEDSQGGILFFAPVSAGSEHDPLPIGEWEVKGVALNPTFQYNPDLFWDADPSHSKAKIPAGPNNPVGVVWIDISKEHYGIHGTPEPKMIGKSLSHGCVRLTNWDALTLAGLVKTGTPVLFKE